MNNAELVAMNNAELAELITRAQKRLDEATEALREIVGELCDALADRDATIAALEEDMDELRRGK